MAVADSFLLQCSVQTYEWGRVGADSTVARFAQSGDPSFKLDANKPYAEVNSVAFCVLCCFDSLRMLCEWLAALDGDAPEGPRKDYRRRF